MMANPFDQFASDFNAALPPVSNDYNASLQPGVAASLQPSQPPMGGQPGLFPPQYQQPVAYGGFQNPPQHPPPPPQFGGYEAQSPARPSFNQNPYEQPPNPVPSPFSTEPHSSFGAPPPPSQPAAPMPSGPFGESASSIDVGNPFAAPSVDSSFGMSTIPPSGQTFGQPGFDMSYQPVNVAPSMQPPAFDGSTGAHLAPQQPPPQFLEPSPYADPWVDPTMSGPPQGASFTGSFTQQDPRQQSVSYGQPSQQPPSQQPPDQNFGALVPSQQQSNPYAAFGQPPTPYAQDPYMQQPPPPQPDQYGQQYGIPPTHDPYGQQQVYGQPYGQPPPQQQYLPPPPPPVDPFSVFETQSKPAEPAPQTTALVSYSGPNPTTVTDDDFWGNFAATNPDPPAPAPAPSSTEVNEPKAKVEEEKKGEEGLPPGGEYYDARIFTPTLGVMFFKPQELTDSLFLNTDREVVDGLAERPVVAFIVEGSSARAAGVELGHVLLKVNGVDVKSPKEASRLIKEGPRPLPLLFYVPNTDVVTAEGEHMVKYDTRETTAPNSAKDWKPKYVVIGGIIAQPWMMNMYRSKSEYDIAVIETQARRPVSVKVKQFSLQGARIQNDWQGPQMVKYKNKLHPWKYIVVLPVARNPIKISSPNLSQLKPVHEGIRRVLLAQQRDRGVGGGGRSVSSRSAGENHGRAYNGYADDRGYSQQQSGYAPQGEARY